MESKKPTRVLIVGPSSLFNLLPRGWLEAARASSGFPLISPVNSSGQQVKDHPVSLILALNRESMLFDPVDWGQLKSELLKLAETACPLLQINELTNRLFCKRTPPRHRPRIHPQLSAMYLSLQIFRSQTTLAKRSKSLCSTWNFL